MVGQKNDPVDEKERDVRGREAAKRFFSGPKNEPNLGEEVEPQNREQIQTSPAHGKFAATEGGGGIFDGMTDAILEGLDERTKRVVQGFQAKPKAKEPTTRERNGRDR